MAIRARSAQHCIMRRQVLEIEETSTEVKVGDAPVASEVRSDQRSQPRFEVGRPANLTVLGTPTEILRGEILNVSEGGTQIRLGQLLQPFTLVRIEYDDNLLLGEVVYCREDQSSWLLGIRVEHGLFGLKALADAMQKF